MTKIYKRLYEITLSEPVIDPDLYKNPPPPPQVFREPVKDSNYNIVAKSTQHIITDLDFEAVISKTRSSGVNELTLTLFNASDTIEAIAEKKGSLVIIKAGYESVHENHSSLPTIFTGQINSIEVVKEETRIVTRIKASDGGEVSKNQRVSYEAPPKDSKGNTTLVSTVITDLASSFDNIVVGHLALEDIEGETFPTGYSAFGILKDILTEVCKSRKLKYSIENNAIYVFPDSWFRIAEQSGIVPYKDTNAAAWEKNVSAAKTTNFAKGQLLTFTPETVISSRKLVDTRGAKNGSGKGAAGLSLKVPTYTKFNTQTDIIKLKDSDELKFDSKIVGEYSIESLTINLNSREGEWTTSLELTNNAEGA